MRRHFGLLALLLAPAVAQAQPSVAASPAPTPLTPAQQVQKEQVRDQAHQVEIRAQDGCPQAEVQAMALPHLKQAMANNQEMVIVSIGSSSTQGWMASDVGHTYPAVLQGVLARALPQTQVVVINRGIGGQDAAEEVPRLQAAAIAAKPQLVIWQVGANGVLRDTDPAVFKKPQTCQPGLLPSRSNRLISAGRASNALKRWISSAVPCPSSAPVARPPRGPSRRSRRWSGPGTARTRAGCSARPASRPGSPAAAFAPASPGPA